LLKTNVSYEIKLPDRIEASVLVLTDFHGIVGKFRLDCNLTINI